MAALFHSAAIRAVLIAGVLAVVAAFTAPTARGAQAESTAVRAGSVSDGGENPSLTLPARTAIVLLADEFTWGEFVRYWGRQLGSMTGVVGTVVLVALAAFLIIMSKGK